MADRKRDKHPSMNFARRQPPELKPGPTEPVTCPECGDEHTTLAGAVMCAKAHRRERNG